MPVPAEYQRATDDFYNLLTDARDSASLITTNQAYTMVQGVLQAFRRRLEVNEAIRFLSVLPVGVRALFVADWDVDEPKRPFEDHYGALWVRYGKTDAARRTLPMAPRVRRILEARCLSANKPIVGWVFPAPTKSGHIRHSA